MKTAIKREINALYRISQNVIEASVNKFDLIPFVYTGPRTADGCRVVYIDALAWYDAKNGKPGLMYEKCLFPDVWEDLHLRATFRPGDSRIVWEAAIGRCVAFWVTELRKDTAASEHISLIKSAAWWNPNCSRRLRYD